MSEDRRSSICHPAATNVPSKSARRPPRRRHKAAGPQNGAGRDSGERRRRERVRLSSRALRLIDKTIRRPAGRARADGRPSAVIECEIQEATRRPRSSGSEAAAF